MSVHLRQLLASDWESAHTWAQLEDVCRYQSWGPNTPDQTREYVTALAAAWDERPQKGFPYAAVLDGRVIGNATLHLRSTHEGEISYAIHPDFWGQGIGTAIGRELLQIGFRDHGLHRVFGTCDPRNTGSARVLTKLGMTHEGRKRENILLRDGWRDTDLYGILEHEWAGAGTRTG